MPFVNGNTRSSEAGKKQHLPLPQLAIRYQRFDL